MQKLKIALYLAVLTVHARAQPDVTPPGGNPGLGIPGAGLFPGLGAGFHKNLDISAGGGFGPFLGGLGLGGVPPIDGNCSILCLEIFHNSRAHRTLMF
jgi:hypothetical protein